MAYKTPVHAIGATRNELRHEYAEMTGETREPAEADMAPTEHLTKDYIRKTYNEK